MALSHPIISSRYIQQIQPNQLTFYPKYQLRIFYIVYSILNFGGKVFVNKNNLKINNKLILVVCFIGSVLFIPNLFFFKELYFATKNAIIELNDFR